VIRPLHASIHKKLNLPEAYINYIDTSILDVNAMTSIEKENQVMRTTSVIARYIAGVIFLVIGLNGFLNFIPLPSPGALLDSSWVPFMSRITSG
jgi:hypothetical protein